MAEVEEEWQEDEETLRLQREAEAAEAEAAAAEAAAQAEIDALLAEEAAEAERAGAFEAGTDDFLTGVKTAGEVAGEAFAGLETNTALAFESAMAAASTDADASVAAAREAAARAAAEVKAKADAEARAAEEKAAAAEAARLAAIKAEEDKRLAEVAAADQQRAKEAKVVVALQEYLAHNPAAFPAFKQASGQYRFAQIDADQYFTIVEEMVGEDNNELLMPLIIDAMPDRERAEALQASVERHAASKEERRRAREAERLAEQEAQRAEVARKQAEAEAAEAARRAEEERLAAEAAERRAKEAESRARQDMLRAKDEAERIRKAEELAAAEAEAAAAREREERAAKAASASSSGGLFMKRGTTSTSAYAGAASTAASSAPAAPAADVEPGSDADHIARLRRFFAAHNPEKVGKETAAFERFGPAVWHALRAKYGDKVLSFHEGLDLPEEEEEEAVAGATGAGSTEAAADASGGAGGAADSADVPSPVAASPPKEPDAEADEGEAGGVGGSAPATGSIADHKQRLKRFFTANNPSKVPEVDKIWEARGMGVWEALERKYPGKTGAYTVGLDLTEAAKNVVAEVSYKKGTLTISMYGSQEGLDEETQSVYAEYVLKVGWSRELHGETVSPSWLVARRYREFNDMHQEIKRAFRTEKELGLVPRFPGKSLFSRSEKVQQGRRIKLTAYLRDLFDRVPAAVYRPEVLAFLHLNVRLTQTLELMDQAEELEQPPSVISALAGDRGVVGSLADSLTPRASSGGGGGGAAGEDGEGKGEEEGDSIRWPPITPVEPMEEAELEKLAEDVKDLQTLLDDLNLRHVDPRADKRIQQLLVRVRLGQRRMEATIGADEELATGITRALQEYASVVEVIRLTSVP